MDNAETIDNNTSRPNRSSWPPSPDPSFYRLVHVVSNLRRFCRCSPVNYHSLAPRVMIIPDDSPEAGVFGGDTQIEGNWGTDRGRLLRVVDEHSLEGLQALLAKGVAVNLHGGAFHETPLHRAAQHGWVEGLQLLLANGATVFSTNQFGQTPLHYASASKSVECVRKLLDAGSHSALDHKDMRGHTPLHDAASVGYPEGVMLLLKAGASVDVKDKNQETPLHKAAKSRCINSMLALLNKGADLGARDKVGESVLGYVLRHIPSGMDALLDHCLVTNADKLSSKKLEVSFNFLPLAGSSEMNQMKNLDNMVQLGHPKLLSHPLCEAFLLLKWHNVRRLFFIEVIFYFAHAILATFLILDKFVWQVVEGTLPEQIPESAFNALKIVLLNQAVFILLKQIFTIVQSVKTWIFSLWHVLNGVIPILVLMVLPGGRSVWQHHFATISLLLIWVQCMLHIGRFPGCGIYVAMFTRVAKVFMRIFLIFFCLLLAFSMSFYVSYYGGIYSYNNESATSNSSSIVVNDQVYSNPIMTFLKTLTMMIGELDFDSHFVEQLRLLPGTSHIIYLTFVILVAIILSNLLVALAVNDVQGLRNSAHLERLIKQMELVFQMEKTFGTISTIANNLNCHWLAYKVKVFVHDFVNTKVFMQPYNPQKSSKLLMFENGMLKELHLRQSHVSNIMECLRLRQEEETSSDRKRSVRRLKSRTIRGEYSTTFSSNDEDLRDTLKQLERSIIDVVNERLDDVTSSFVSMSSRIKHLEAALVGDAAAGFDSEHGLEGRGGVGSFHRQELNGPFSASDKRKKHVSIKCPKDLHPAFDHSSLLRPQSYGALPRVNPGSEEAKLRTMSHPLPKTQTDNPKDEIEMVIQTHSGTENKKDDPQI